MSLYELSNLAMKDAWLIPLLPFLAFILILITGVKLRYISAFISISGISLSFIVATGVLLGRLANPQSPPLQESLSWIAFGTTSINTGLLIDNLSAIMVFFVSLVATLIQIYSIGYMDHEEDAGFSRYFSYMSLFAASMLGLVLASNLFSLYICWELVGLCSYLLIGYWYRKKIAADAAKKAFVVTRFGDLGLLIGMVFLYMLTGTTDFVGVREFLPALGAVNITIISLLIFSGAVGKSAQFPLHIWLPDAMEGPTPVSALIHAATMVAAGVYLVARCFHVFAAAPVAPLIVAYIGAITALIAACMAMVQNDIKRVLAYSTISQLGYMMLALGVGGYIGATALAEAGIVAGSQGYVAGTFHLVTHAFFKALLFLCAGSAIHAVATNNMWEMGGLGRKMPVTGLTFLVGTLAISGIPPFSGFFSKDEILATISSLPQHPLLIIIAFLVVFMTAYYMFRAYYLTFCGEYRGKNAPHESPYVMTLPLIILGLFTAVIGFTGIPGHSHIEHFLMAGFGHADKVHVAWIPMTISLVLAFGGIGCAHALYAKRPRENEAMLKNRISPLWKLFEKKFYMDDFWEWIIRKILFVFARISEIIDVYIIDGIVNLIGYLLAAAGTRLRYEESGKVQQYAFMIVIFLLVTGIGFLAITRYINLPSIPFGG
ncbi:MAG: NADH-quinone oxidoreductase subunit L [Candidatus Eremiobacteraeota bacterium]|nr:NADH-quinone oxidoreductase subunit L [Candidatus Eremiobacteraeota bacterium]